MTDTTSYDIRRHADGSIDFDFYRANATALRRQAMRDGATLRNASAGVLTMVAALAMVGLVSATFIPAPSGHAAVAQAKVSPIR